MSPPARITCLTTALGTTACFLLLSITSSAQSSAAVQGEVTDQNAAVISDAQVIVHCEANGIQRRTTTDGGGRYLFSGLPVGSYRVEASAEGFQTQIVEQILEVGRTITQNFQLRVGNVSQIVTVPTNHELLERSTMALGHVVDQKMVQETPLNGRYFLDLGLRVPGSVTPPPGGFLGISFPRCGFAGH